MFSLFWVFNLQFFAIKVYGISICSTPIAHITAISYYGTRIILRTERFPFNLKEFVLDKFGLLPADCHQRNGRVL